MKCTMNFFRTESAQRIALSHSDSCLDDDHDKRFKADPLSADLGMLLIHVYPLPSEEIRSDLFCPFETSTPGVFRSSV